ncbi:TRAP transporter small permease [Hoeflea sp.]|uniref:TRAP transporter small permease n=1 Tax=Hoeflea sp. TaxID=1940281 RepID=UPI003B023B83
MSERIERWVEILARLTALAGGLVLTALVIITVISVTGRSLVFTGLAPVPGDFELVEAGTAFAVFAFLPWCHLKRGNAVVEVLTMHFSDTANRFIEIIANLMMMILAVLICWRHWLGTIDKYGYQETTFILQFPIWWAYAAGLFGAVVFVIVSVWCFWRSIVEYRSGSNVPISGELS